MQPGQEIITYDNPLDPEGVSGVDPIRANQPPAIRLTVFANMLNLNANDPGLHQAIRGSNLVVSLGGVDLFALAQAMNAAGATQTPGLAVLGPNDSADPEMLPDMFTVLHGHGRRLGDWSIAGIGGSPLLNYNQQGFYIDDNEASIRLESLEAADIFISHAWPGLLQESHLSAAQGMSAIDNYLIEHRPLYYFYAHPHQTIAEEYNQGATLAVGVNGFITTPLLEYY